MIRFEFTGCLKEASEGGPFRCLPERGTKYSAGYDFYCPTDVEIQPHQLKYPKSTDSITASAIFTQLFPIRSML